MLEAFVTGDGTGVRAFGWSFFFVEVVVGVEKGGEQGLGAYLRSFFGLQTTNFYFYSIHDFFNGQSFHRRTADPELATAGMTVQ